MDCAQAVGPSFDWAREGEAGGDQLPGIKLVEANLTSHSATATSDALVTQVIFAAGPLALVGTGSQEVMEGNLTCWINTGSASSPFTSLPQAQVGVRVSVTGEVTLVQLIGGNLFLNRKPQKYVTTCEPGLLRGTWSAGVGGMSSWTLSFANSLGPEPPGVSW